MAAIVFVSGRANVISGVEGRDFILLVIKLNQHQYYHHVVPPIASFSPPFAVLFKKLGNAVYPPHIDQLHL